MKQIIVASNNPVKIAATRDGFCKMFPEDTFDLHGVQINSGVGSQPMSEEETLAGAINRAKGAQLAHTSGDYWVGIEGGIQSTGDEMLAFAWVAILSSEREGKGRTGAFILPPQVRELIRAGYELGAADDIVFSRVDSKRKNGAVGLLTGDVIDRVGFYSPAVILALIPFKNPDLYPLRRL